MINKAGDSLGTPVQDMRIDHGRPDVFVSHQFLYGPDIIPVFKKMGCKQMEKYKGTGCLVDPCFI